MILLATSRERKLSVVVLVVVRLDDDDGGETGIRGIFHADDGGAGDVGDDGMFACGDTQGERNRGVSCGGGRGSQQQMQQARFANR